MRLALVLAAAALLAGCGSSPAPKDDPGAFAVNVVRLITGNSYARAWQDLHSRDQKVAPLEEYILCESRSPVLTAPTSVRVVKIADQPVGLGDGSFVPSKAVDVRIAFPGQEHVLVHTVHVVAEGGRWKWILPSWRFRDYRANTCPTDAGSSPPPASA